MAKLLREILDNTFIIPISDDEIDIIEKVVGTFMDNMEVEQLQLCGDVYFRKIRIGEFHEQLEKMLPEEVTNMPQLPHLAYVGLAEYILCSVVKDEEQDNDFRFLTSLYIRNSLVCEKFENHLFYPKLLVDALGYTNDYLQRNDIPENIQYTFKPAIFEANSLEDIFDGEISLDQDKFLEIKQLAIKAEKYDFEQTKMLLAKNHCNDKFQKAIDVAYELSHISQWIKVDATPKETIKSILSTSVKQKTLDALNLDLSSYQVENIQSNSSVLLNYLFTDGDKDERIGKTKFSPMEFAVYLYYEFLLEKFLVEYGK